MDFVFEQTDVFEILFHLESYNSEISESSTPKKQKSVETRKDVHRSDGSAQNATSRPTGKFRLLSFTIIGYWYSNKISSTLQHAIK